MQFASKRVLAALVAAFVVWWWANQQHPADTQETLELPALVSSCAAPELPDFLAYPAGAARKQAFFDYLLPWVRCENDVLLHQADTVAALREQSLLQPAQQAWLRELCQHYLPAEQCAPSVDWNELSLRVGAVPASLVLVQAANESGWGTSRFAREANNLFGQWCFAEGCGLVPFQQRDGFHYEVRHYANVSESLRSYMHNLNTHTRYQSFRKLRYRFRSESRQLSGVQLAEGLEGYSERGEAYIRELQQMIRHNRLQQVERKPGERELFASDFDTAQ
ncbi:MAG TPA: glucosaminidase domain-containing protein [Spongiibacteraceae bacterium]|jgi:Bax protein|nr:glucosaminidase domain-containing protein [Spongiibacteraceae bacterium]HUH38610.1 glucosaminidase domain-containing protein [Spongiibacteraceae bacterium]